MPGVAQVSVLGGAEREIQVLYDPDKLAEHELTPAILEQFLALQNAMVPGGVIENNGFRDTRSHRQPLYRRAANPGPGHRRKPPAGAGPWRPFGLPCCMSKTWPRSSTAVKDPTGYARVDGRPTVLLQVL